MKLDTITVEAPAKINLFLDVVGKRDDGYHDIKSILMPISISDTIEIEETDGDIETIVVNGGVDTAEDLCLSDSEDNLATRAAVALKEETGYKGGARIKIQKNIPVGGGLGGGSADSAVVLKSLNKLWKTGLPVEKLMEVGAKLGCDIPALVHGGVVCMEGVGEKISPVSIDKTAAEKGWWVVIVNPSVLICTGDIYSRYSSSLTSSKIPFNSIASSLEEGDIETVAKSLYNGLQETVFTKYPLVKILAEKLKNAGALGVLLSGSGASVFGLARDEGHAQEVVKNFETAVDSSVWTKIAKTCPMV